MQGPTGRDSFNLEAKRVAYWFSAPTRFIRCLTTRETKALSHSHFQAAPVWVVANNSNHEWIMNNSLC